jgi:hypothetical protein
MGQPKYFNSAAKLAAANPDFQAWNPRVIELTGACLPLRCEVLVVRGAACFITPPALYIKLDKNASNEGNCYRNPLL